MKTITLNVTKRTLLGKASAKKLRKAGKIPCVLYNASQNIHFAAEEQDFNQLVYTPNVYMVLIKLDDNSAIKAIIQTIDFHPVTDKIIHVDFYQLSETKKATLDIPVKITGTAIGVLNSGGNFRLAKRKLTISALPKNLPDFINIDVSSLALGQKIYTADCKNNKYQILHPDNTVVCRVERSRVSIKEEEAAEKEESSTTK